MTIVLLTVAKVLSPMTPNPIRHHLPYYSDEDKSQVVHLLRFSTGPHEGEYCGTQTVSVDFAFALSLVGESISPTILSRCLESFSNSFRFQFLIANSKQIQRCGL
jgi:hypothetical protein